MGRAPFSTLLALAWRESRTARRRLLLYMSSISLGVAVGGLVAFGVVVPAPSGFTLSFVAFVFFGFFLYLVGSAVFLFDHSVVVVFGGSGSTCAVSSFTLVGSRRR